jgi:hypothetical protein
LAGAGAEVEHPVSRSHPLGEAQEVCAFGREGASAALEHVVESAGLASQTL